MTQIFSRRDMLRSASGLIAASTLGGLLGNRAVAADAGPGRMQGKYVHNRAYAPIDQALQKAIDNKTVVGVVGMGATDKGIVYEGTFGKADLTAGTPMTLDTVVWLLSMSKAITATACMQLVEQGKLKLDQPASQILPELKSPMVLDGFDAAGKPKLRPAKRPITVRHMLTHTSGYTYPVWSENILRYEKATNMPDIAYSMNGAFTAPLEFDPGDRWEYGISLDWVGKLVEAVTDQSLEVYFRENIFTPLGMHNSGFLISSAQKKRVATMYNRQPDGSLTPAPFEMSQRPEFFSGGGGLFSTPRDYMAFLQMLVRGGTFNGARILKPETVAMMFKNQIGDLNAVEMKTALPAYSNSFDEFPGMVHKWGFSFDINTQPGPHGRSAGSGSWGGLLNCYYWIDPVKHVTGAMFTQLLPFFDARVVDLWGQFEEGLYGGLRRA